MTDAAPSTGWVPHRPEQRFSIVVSRFLNAALVLPFYVTAIHDADEGTRTDRQRMRDKQRGQEPGQLDYDVVQGFWNTLNMIPICRKLELKRGKNSLSDNQRVTFKKLMDCGAKPCVAWTLREVHSEMVREGFRFLANVETSIQKYEAQLDALDRAAELTKAGAAPKPKRAARKAEPRYTLSKTQARRANARGYA